MAKAISVIKNGKRGVGRPKTGIGPLIGVRLYPDMQQQLDAWRAKQPDAPSIPGDPDRVLASMGNYIFTTNTLLAELYADAQNPDSSNDFGRDILPSLVGRGEIFAYDFQTNRIPGDPSTQQPYWRDVGTIDAFYEANMDLNHVKPDLNLYNREWPMRSTSYPDPPAKFVFDEEGRRGQALDSIVSGGCILSGRIAAAAIDGRKLGSESQ